MRRELFNLGLYVLEGHQPVPISDTLEWAKWFENYDNRHLASDHINGYRVSTVFLAIDNTIGRMVPLLFETMIFSDTETTESPILHTKFPKSLENYTRRYATWDEAIAGHQEALTLIREGAI